jgi:hypothetical protein
VVELAPQDRIQLSEQAGRVVVPAPPEILRQCGQTLVTGSDEQPAGARLAHDRRELRSCRHHEPHFIPSEHARLDRLDDQHALQKSTVDQRHAQERVVGIFAGFAEILEARVPCRVRDDLRPQLLADQSHQALVEPHSHLAHAFRPQPDSRRQHEVCAVGLQQVHGAHVGRKAPLDEPDDVRQGLGWITAMRDQVADLFQGPQERSLVGWHGLAPGWWSTRIHQTCSLFEASSVAAL